MVGNIQIRSVLEPYGDPRLLAPLLSLYTKADAMGLLPAKPIVELSPATVREVLRALQSEGLLGAVPMSLMALITQADPSTAETIAALAEVHQVIDDSPVPGKEWPAMRAVFADEDLSSLLNVSPSSLKRYAAAERPTPDEIAERLHWLAMVVAALSGSYNDLGIRRWFERPRAQLEGKSPRQALGRNWSPGTPSARRVRDLAESLMAGGGI